MRSKILMEYVVLIDYHLIVLLAAGLLLSIYGVSLGLTRGLLRVQHSAQRALRKLGPSSALAADDHFDRRQSSQSYQEDVSLQTG
jgi:hypothetical protein